MADERDLELLDDYLTNRLSAADRSALEQRLQADPDLQREYAVQKRLINGIKEARIAELKSMLNQVPVPAQQPGNSLGTKILLGTVLTLVIAATAFLYFRRDETKQESATVAQQPAIADQAQHSDSEVQHPAPSPDVETPVLQDRQSVESDRNQTSAGTEHSRPSLAKKPDPVQAPSSSPSGADRKRDTAPLVVETHAGTVKYNFHYKISDGTISLYGPFGADNYEVIHYPSDGNDTLIALYHKGDFYLLDNFSGQTMPLSPVKDAELTKKLSDYHSAQ